MLASLSEKLSLSSSKSQVDAEADTTFTFRRVSVEKKFGNRCPNFKSQTGQNNGLVMGRIFVVSREKTVQ